MNGHRFDLSHGVRTAIYLALFVLLSFARPAEAICLVQPESGSWVNVDPNARALARAELEFNCQDTIVNGVPFPPGPPWRIHLWGACAPAECDWGVADAGIVTIGSRTFIRAIFYHGFATRYVYADMSLYREGQLWIWMWTDFTDPARADYASQDWFIQR